MPPKVITFGNVKTYILNISSTFPNIGRLYMIYADISYVHVMFVLIWPYMDVCAQIGVRGDIVSIFETRPMFAFQRFRFRWASKFPISGHESIKVPFPVRTWRTHTYEIPGAAIHRAWSVGSTRVSRRESPVSLAHPHLATSSLIKYSALTTQPTPARAKFWRSP